MKFETPAILFLVFNRPDRTAESLKAIRAARPARLFVVGDGPREGNENDARRCAEVRRLIENGVDWDCDLKTDFRPANLGCRYSVSKGITWFFEQVEEGIVLEDDTVASPAFFPYCSELLERYRHDENVLMVSGHNFQFGRKRGAASYYATRYAQVWGWASWRRAWSHYDVNMTSYEERWDRAAARWNFTEEEDRYWRETFACVRKFEVDTWDFQWQYVLLEKPGVCLASNSNLVTNIGFGADASHTISETSPFSRIPIQEFRIAAHPKQLVADRRADAFTFNHFYKERPADKWTLVDSAMNWLWRQKHCA